MTRKVSIANGMVSPTKHMLSIFCGLPCDVRVDVKDSDIGVAGLMENRLCDDIPQMEGYVFSHHIEESEVRCVDDTRQLLAPCQSPA